MRERRPHAGSLQTEAGGQRAEASGVLGAECGTASWTGWFLHNVGRELAPHCQHWVWGRTSPACRSLQELWSSGRSGHRDVPGLREGLEHGCAGLEGPVLLKHQNCTSKTKNAGLGVSAADRLWLSWPWGHLSHPTGNPAHLGRSPPALSWEKCPPLRDPCLPPRAEKRPGNLAFLFVN